MIVRLDLEINDNTLLELPDNVKRFCCSDNGLKSLSELPKGLEKLLCRNNKLTNLPNLPNSLIELDCSDNKLTSLPELPEGLEILNITSNKITSLPKLPNSLKEFYFQHNPLECLLPEKFIQYKNNSLWYMKYYMPFIDSFYGQDKILSNDKHDIGKLIKQLSYMSLKLHPGINIKYADVIQAYELNLL